ncbi:hypothetical protein GCM10027614_02430 [Micromonospora vulcania]
MTDSFSTPETGFADLLRRHREAAGLTQMELARRSGLSATTVRDLEQRRTLRPTQRSVSGLASALQLDRRPAIAFHRAATARTERVTTAVRPVPAGRATVSVLGPLAVHCGENVVFLTSSRQRALLARLAISAGSTVSRAELLEVLWEGEQPQSVVNLLHTYVARLRRTLDSGGDGRAGVVLAYAPGGYRLDLAEDQLDLLRFRRLVTEAEEVADRAPEQAATLLADALALWRDDPLTDVDALAGHPAVAALTASWTTAAVRYADLLDRCGDYEPVVGTLRRLAGRHPLNERVHGRLILALGATGRQGEAYAEYDGIVRRLADQLGVSPSTELLAYHQRLLRQEWTGTSQSYRVPVPQQAPASVADFTGRVDELRQLRELLAPQAPRTAQRPAPVCVVAGPPGVGKTALALATAERLATAFPDGQLYADLRGRSARPASTGEVLARFLHGLGMSGDRGPGDDETAAALLRSVLVSRRILLVLDDARDAAQVRPCCRGWAVAGCWSPPGTGWSPWRAPGGSISRC